MLSIRQEMVYRRTDGVGHSERISRKGFMEEKQLYRIFQCEKDFIYWRVGEYSRLSKEFELWPYALKGSDIHG